MKVAAFWAGALVLALVGGYLAATGQWATYAGMVCVCYVYGYTFGKYAA